MGDDSRFKALLAELVASMPDADSASRIQSAFSQHWAAPPLAELELVLRRTLPLDEARRLLFFPEPDDMRAYVSLVARAPRGAPPEHPQMTVRMPALAMLYMRHSREWRLARPFLLAGGLRTLGDAIGDENVYLRAQAIDVLVWFTSPDVHDWFAEPIPDPEVHQRFLDLASPDANFLQHVALNLTESFPGGSYYCLQALAFWLSLVRYFYCRDRVLRPSAPLMRLLRSWASDASKPPEEAELATRLVDDFGRFTELPTDDTRVFGAAGVPQGEGGVSPGTVSGEISLLLHGAGGGPFPCGAVPGGAAAGAGGVGGAELGGRTEREEVVMGKLGGGARDKGGGTDVKQPDSPLLGGSEAAPAAGPTAATPLAASASVDSVSDLKRRGNAAFAAGKLDSAISLYTRALEFTEPVMTEFGVGPSTATEASALRACAAAADAAAAATTRATADEKVANGSAPDGEATAVYLGAVGERPALLANRAAAHLRTAAQASASLLRSSDMAEESGDWEAAALFLDKAASASHRSFHAALADATAAVAEAPGYGKAYFRQGMALQGLGRHAEAAAVFEKGMGVAPGNAELMGAWRRARDRAGGGDAGEARGREGAAVEGGGLEEAVGVDLARRDEQGEGAAGSEGRDRAPPPATAASPAAERGGVTRAGAVDYNRAAAVAARAAAIAGHMPRAGGGTRGGEGGAGRGCGLGGDGRGGRGDSCTTATPHGSLAASSLPRSAQAFERAWRQVGASPPSAQAAWLCRIPAEAFPSMFGESLSEDCLVSLLHAMERFVDQGLVVGAAGRALNGGNGCTAGEDAEADRGGAPGASSAAGCGASGATEAACCAAASVSQVMRGLSSTRRFKVLRMFLAAEHAAIVPKLVAALRAAGAEHALPGEVQRAWQG